METQDESSNVRNWDVEQAKLNNQLQQQQFEDQKFRPTTRTAAGFASGLGQSRGAVPVREGTHRATLVAVLAAISAGGGDFGGGDAFGGGDPFSDPTGFDSSMNGRGASIAAWASAT